MSDTPQMRDGQRIWTIVVLSLGIFSVALAGVGALWWKNQGSTWFAEGKLAFEEGQALGPTGDNTMCLEHSLQRLDRCAGLGCEIGSIVFLNACLAKAHPNPDFCVGVPKQSEIFDSLSWREERCHAVGSEGDSCENLFATVQGYCQGLRTRGVLDPIDPEARAS